ncbi:MAG: undecaprenyl-diphosphate phosphatase [Spirochaetaceae bacterium]|nr:undecaprenyl-diphosphate phosphatase [Spirochaetaceae bacterium]
MTIFQGIFLGILQGVAEFLPISSSGHLAIVQRLFNLEEIPLLFDIFLHLATLGAVVLFFWKKIWSLLCVFGRWLCRRSKPEDSAALGTILALVLGTAVTGVFGLVLSDLIPDLPIKIVCCGFIVTALLLIFSGWLERRRVAKKNIDMQGEAESSQLSVKPLQGLLIGFAQGIGVLPGISRSGSTIAGALLCGVNRSTAGEFSFLLSIPAILGAFLLEVKDIGQMGGTVGVIPLVAGCIAAFISGFFALALLMKIIRKGKLEWFAAYLIPVGILGIILL